MAAEALLSLADVHVSFGRQHVLRGVSLDIPEGGIFTIVGPNGGGKSTLLRVALGLQSPSHGKVTRRGKLTIGYVPQRVTIERTLPLTVRRFLTLALNWRESASHLQYTLSRVRAEYLLDAQVHDLSGGEMQRVLLARALLRRPQLLVLDEPVAGVDVTGQAEIYDLIGKVRDETGCGVLMVSHDLHLVMAATDQVVCLNGHVCCAGTPQAVSRHPEYLSLFGTRVGASLAVYEHHHDHRHVGSEIKPLGDGGCTHGPGCSHG
ncbi:zinc ABC transporter ATP-binding protein ZnuC [Telmatospirillum sp. J64-1]|uniref:zinc ABC transporter ATP-binding protein ZnuC n=1 Tax=Telmatospirillum sp. J64-1 TaxID=2502183 RepID=UPI00115D7FE8|nr:zinc ABC transporter ATP-binding protein ZnuC [Telmatospirillum sp. J64-1]